MTRLLLRTIIANEISIGGNCSKILESDGVTTSDLVIRKMRGIFEGVSANVRSIKHNAPGISDSAGIAKNLDEYQFAICSMVGSLPDSDPNKKPLQKYRVAIIAAFANLVPLITSPEQKLITKWNFNARLLLMESSEFVTKARSGASGKNIGMNNKNPMLAEAFTFFGVPENELDKELDALY